jgi:hypothetical protein
MSDHSSSRTFQGPETPDAFLADRQRFWNSFTNLTFGSVVFLAVLLILMAIFLL